MKNKIAFLAILFFVAVPAVIWAAQKTMTVYTWDGDIGIDPSGGGAGGITFVEHLEGFTPGDSTPGSVNVDLDTRVVNLGNSQDHSCGVLWYVGNYNHECKDGTEQPGRCTSAGCDFDIGFRAYFDFRFLTTDPSVNSTTHGDGFTFAVINADNNTTSDRGGPPPGVSMGELMCYAGSGTSGNGLRGPKFALEFDTYGNTGAMTDFGCSSGRADPNNLNHIALMYWGNESTVNCPAGSTARSLGAICSRDTYDDNIHGQGGDGTGQPWNRPPVNSIPGDGGYCQRTGGKVTVGPTTYNWMEDGQTHRVRIEVTRTPSGGQRGFYRVKAWVDCEQPCCSGTTCTPCPDVEISNFQNVLNSYNNSDFLPKINREIEMNNARNIAFNEMIFGFTQGTGGATQNIEISNFKLYFTCPGDCDYTLNPYIAYHEAGGSTGSSVAVTTTAGCSWTAQSNNPWITVTSGLSGTGNGTVTYDVAPSTSHDERTGTITIGGLNVGIIQEGTCAFSIDPQSDTVGRNAGSHYFSVNMTGNCDWSAVSSAAWLTITSGASGTGSGTINYSYTRNGGWFSGPRTATITVDGPGGEQVFSLCQDGYFSCP